MTNKGLRRKLWEQIRLFIKNRDSNKCWLCSTTVVGSNAHCSHILPKGLYSRYEYEEWNLKTLCMHCHKHRWHKDPLNIAIEFREKYPAKFVEARKMTSEYEKAAKLTPEVLMAKYLFYTQKNS